MNLPATPQSRARARGQRGRAAVLGLGLGLGLGIAAAVAGTSSAWAQTPGYRLEVPADWQSTPEQAARIAAEMHTAWSEAPLLPGLSVDYQVSAWRGADAALVVTEVRAAPAPDADAAQVPGPGQVLRGFLDQLSETPQIAALAPGDTETLRWDQQRTGDAVDARLRWRHSANQTTTLSRAWLYASPERATHMVRADCLIATLAVAEEHAGGRACLAVLESLRLGDDARAPLPELPPASAAPGPDATAPPAEPAPSAPASAPPRASARGDYVLTPPSLRAPGPGQILAVNPQEREQRSPTLLYVLGGALLAIGVLFTLRDRRAAAASRDDEAGDTSGDGDAKT